MAMKSTISALPLRSTNPTGFCIQPLASRIQRAERLVASATIQMETAWKVFDTLSQPKIHTPMNTDSRKNARVASMASGAPKISPT